ncbi:hypothetical protein EWM64_g8692 [Hericium alpestre]|uniref:Uncharacterized protein n=1 Tax=Hericium alpestre TaxID=135208 RepID=A0A4Y9ZPG2_9AGAM|nr:hypothetical protein EWM64_g8692 [Hericium alpestre]
MSANSRPFGTLSIDCNYSVPIKYSPSLLFTALGSQGHTAGYDTPTRIHVNWAKADNTWPELVQDFCKKVCLADIHTLHMAGNQLRKLSKRPLQDLLSRMPALTSLVLTGLHSSIIFSLLAKATPKSKGTIREEKAAPQFLPSLKDMTIKAMVLGAELQSGKTTFGYALKAMLQKRVSLGAKVETLLLKDCFGTEVFTDGLQGCVGTLVVEPEIQ